MSMKYKNSFRLSCLLSFLLMFASVAFAAVPSEDNKPSPRTLFSQAVAMSVNGDWLSAEKLFQQVALAHPEWPEPKNNLAIVLLKMDKVEQAQKAIESAVISLPSFKVAQENRKRLYDHAAAVAYYKAVGDSRKPDFPKLQLLHEINEAVPKADKPAEKANPEEIHATSKQQVSGAIEAKLITWSKSWSDVNIDQYLSAYSTQFRPSGAEKDYTQWSRHRRAKFRLTGSIRVELQDVKVYVRNNEKQALAEFIQNYQSNQYQDKVIKQLHLVLENGQWLIQSERVLQQLN
jgi:tetratricopeptide (TPR) repeat protein